MISTSKFVCCLFLISQVYCANILYLHGVISVSHHIWNRVLAKELASRGHNVTFLSTDEPSDVTKNLHYIVLENSYKAMYSSDGQDKEFDMMKSAKEFHDFKFLGAALLADYGVTSCKAVMKSKDGFERILNYPPDFQFDLVIYDFTCGPCLAPLIHRFNNPPLVTVSAFLNPTYTDYIIGGHKYPAYVPHFIVNYVQNMNFIQRMHNFILYFIEKLSFKFILYPEIEKMAREKFQFKDMPSLREIEQKTKLLLLNSDQAIDYPEPLQPNMILVGGLQITDPKELPQDMKQFVEGAKKGAVLMSLGTNIKSDLLGNEILTSILKTFESLPDYNFIWKFESELDDLPIKPSKNVMIGKFLPQNDLLAHPNLVAFITHAGGLSTQESLWYGKPMVGIPFIADQYRTIDKSVAMGVGVKLDIATLKADNFRAALLKVLEEKKFSENAQKVSKLFQDKPKKPLDTAVWWIEFVLRNPEAPIYRSPTLDLGFLASNSLDIYLCVIVFIHLSVYFARKLFCKIFKRRPSVEAKKVKKN